MYVKENTTRQSLRGLNTPGNTRTHHPVAHAAAVDYTLAGMARFGLTPTSERHELTNEGDRLFSIFEIDQGGPDYKFNIGMRNAHDKSVSFGLCLGTTVTVCSNLMFGGVVCNKRKHTNAIMDDIYTVITDAVGSFCDQFKVKNDFFANMKQAEMSDAQANDIMIQALDAGIVSGSHLPYALEEWRTPSHPEFQDRNAWSLYNAFTETHKRTPRLASLPEKGQALDTLFQSVVGVDEPVTLTL